jgi:hypothetical protein
MLLITDICAMCEVAVIVSCISSIRFIYIKRYGDITSMFAYCGSPPLRDFSYKTELGMGESRLTFHGSNAIE